MAPPVPQPTSNKLGEWRREWGVGPCGTAHTPEIVWPEIGLPKVFGVDITMSPATISRCCASCIHPKCPACRSCLVSGRLRGGCEHPTLIPASPGASPGDRVTPGPPGLVGSSPWNLELFALIRPPGEKILEREKGAFSLSYSNEDFPAVLCSSRVRCGAHCQHFIALCQNTGVCVWGASFSFHLKHSLSVARVGSPWPRSTATPPRKKLR